MENYDPPMKILDLADLSTWPQDILSHLEKNYSLYLGWEARSKHRSSAFAYDTARYNLKALIRNSGCAIRGYHCTRLTEAEIHTILVGGMSLPNLALLHKRIADVVTSEILEESVAQRLMSNNQANDAKRAGMIWFCFFPPYTAGQWGIERFFRSWGGEALYNSHEDDPITGPVLAKIGVPCIIEALVPTVNLPRFSWLDTRLIRRFLVHRGFKSEEELDHEDRSESPIPSEHIVRIIRFPDADFISLTGCSKWKPPLS
jgi:hypothetical protein